MLSCDIVKCHVVRMLFAQFLCCLQVRSCLKQNRVDEAQLTTLDADSEGPSSMCNNVHTAGLRQSAGRAIWLYDLVVRYSAYIQHLMNAAYCNDAQQLPGCLLELT